MKPKSDKHSLFHWYDSILLRIVPPVAALAIKLLMLSCRVVKVEGREKEREAIIRSGGGAIYATWHQRLTYHFHYFGTRHITVMISQSRDGEYAAKTARWLGFRCVRGSSTRGGVGALKDLTEKIIGGEIGGMVGDGPVGPPRVAKMGVLFMSRNAEVPVIPVLWGADRCWVLNTWDRFLIPKPFARVVICYADPIWVPQSARGEELETYRRLVENNLNMGAGWCDEYFGPERPWRKATK